MKVIALYDGGDAILSVAGNEGFRILKMRKAHCSLRWTQISSEKRPEIPLSLRVISEDPENCLRPTQMNSVSGNSLIAS